jgi:hypothetical protein
MEIILIRKILITMSSSDKYVEIVHKLQGKRRENKTRHENSVIKRIGISTTSSDATHTHNMPKD